MSHVDEGRLHAFLDGALSAADPADAERVELHLAACVDCRSRVDEAARLRDEASALLGSAQPRAFVMPSFDAIRARSATVAPAQRVKPSIFRSPFNDFAWAAMLMLAIGLGWLLNDTMEGDRRVIATRPESAALDQSGGATTYEIPLAPTVADADRQVASAESQVEAGDAAPERGMATVQAPAPVMSAPTGAGVSERVAEYDVVQEAEAPPALSDADRRSYAAEERTANAARSEELASRAPSPMPVAPPPPAPQAGSDMAGAMLGAGAADEGWRAISVTEAQRLTDGKLVRIAGARITSSAARGSGADLEVRTVQLTERGESIKVVQRRTEVAEARPRIAAADAQAEMPAAETVTAGLTVRVEEWTVTLSGAVAPERLRELAANLS